MSKKQDEFSEWIIDQKFAYACGELTPDQISKLESIKGWKWDFDDIVESFMKSKSKSK